MPEVMGDGTELDCMRYRDTVTWFEVGHFMFFGRPYALHNIQELNRFENSMLEKLVMSSKL